MSEGLNSVNIHTHKYPYNKRSNSQSEQMEALELIIFSTFVTLLSLPKEVFFFFFLIPQRDGQSLKDPLTVNGIKMLIRGEAFQKVMHDLISIGSIPKIGFHRRKIS